MAPQTTADKAYDKDSIQVKEGIEHVRARPAMYIGDVYERGLHHLVSEVVDNSIDEAMAKHCTEINVSLHEDGSITILDNGRGIPVGIHKKVGKPTLEVCLTVLGAGGKFDKDSYKVSGGLHGVGVSCVNALSEWLEAEVYRQGKEWRMRFERGRTTKQLEEVGKTQRRGTKITFKPDQDIFKKNISFDYKTIANRLRELAYLNKGLNITIHDARGEENKDEEFLFPKGIVEFVDYLSTSEDNLLREPIYLTGRTHSPDSGGTVDVEIALQYQDTYSETLVSYTNNINTIEGGTHLTGFRTALTSSFNAWIKGNDKLLKKGQERPSGDDYREGLIAVISIKVPEPQFEGQTKTKLGNSDVAGIVQSVVGLHLRAWCEQNPQQAKKVINKAVQACKARAAARKARNKIRMDKDSLGGGGVAKLKPCESKNPDECELYLVEGDSAGGTASEARDWNTQAILPLRGKILNVWKATHEKMLGHSEIATMIQVLETGILAEFDIKKLRYHKIVIMCDADVDGSHIRTLILTFFFRQMPELIQAGHIYVAQPPLFKVSPKGKKRKKGEHEDADSKYFTEMEDFSAYMLGLGLDGAGLARSDGSGDRVEGQKLSKLIDLVSELARQGRDVAKKSGRAYEKYLSRQREDGHLPYARLRFPKLKKSQAKYTEEELDEALKAARAELGDIKVWMDTDPLSEREGADLEITRFENKKRLEQVLEGLAELGFSWRDCFPPPQEEGAPTVFPFTVSRTKDTAKILSLADLNQTVQELGTRGVEVQRYKGLGEMDAEELEITTMRPGNRMMLQVTLEDMADANHIFSVLMGSKVEPRRAYIAKHALSVEAAMVDA